MPNDTRYEDGPEDAEEIIRDLVKTKFTPLAGALIKVIFDTKMKKTRGKIRFAEIQTLNEMKRYLSLKEQEEGYDYFIIIDKLLWTKVILDRIDKVRILRHELCHADVNIEANTPFGLCGHEIEDFYSEVEANADDPRWGLRLAELLAVQYEAEKNPQKQLF